MSQPSESRANDEVASLEGALIALARQLESTRTDARYRVTRMQAELETAREQLTDVRAQLAALEATGLQQRLVLEAKLEQASAAGDVPVAQWLERLAPALQSLGIERARADMRELEAAEARRVEADLREQLAQKSDALTKLQARLQELEDTLAETVQSHRRSELARQDAEAALAESQRARKTLEDKYAALEQAHVRELSDLSSALTTELEAAAAQQAETLEQRADAQAARAEALEGRAHTAEQSLNEARAQLEGLRSRVQAFESETQRLQATVAEAQQARVDDAQAREALTEEVAQLEARLAELRSEAAAQKTAYAQAEGARAQVGQQAASLKEQLAAAEAALAEQRPRIALLEGQLSDERTRRTEAEADLQARLSEATGVAERFSAAQERKAAEASAEAERLAARIKELEAEMGRQTRELERRAVHAYELETGLSERAMADQQLAAELEQAQTSLAERGQEVERYATQVSQLQASLSTERARSQADAARADALQARLAAFEGQAEAEREHADVRTEMVKREKERVSALKLELAERQAEVGSLRAALTKAEQLLVARLSTGGRGVNSGATLPLSERPLAPVPHAAPPSTAPIPRVSSNGTLLTGSASQQPPRAAIDVCSHDVSTFPPEAPPALDHASEGVPGGAEDSPGRPSRPGVPSQASPRRVASRPLTGTSYSVSNLEEENVFGGSDD